MLSSQNQGAKMRGVEYVIERNSNDDASLKSLAGSKKGNDATHDTAILGLLAPDAFKSPLAVWLGDRRILSIY